MKKGVTFGVFPKGMQVKEVFAMAKAAGLDGVEVSFTESGELRLDSTPAEVAAVKTAAKEEGIELYSVFSGVYWKHPFTYEPEMETAMKMGYRQIEIAAALDCNSVLIVPGIVSGANDPMGDIPYDVAYDRALECMTKLAAFGKERGVRVGIENVWNKFLLSPLEMRNFVDEAGAAAYFDAGNVLVNGYPEHWIKILGERICKVHVKDFSTKIGNINGFVGMFDGNMDFKSTMDALRAVGYDDYITAEYGCCKAAPEVRIATLSAALDKLISY